MSLFTKFLTKDINKPISTKEIREAVYPDLVYLDNKPGSTFESKTFALNAAGTSIAGSDAGITLEQSGATAIIRIPTAKTLKLWQGLTFEALTTYSDGRSDGAIHVCTGVLAGAISSNNLNCIYVDNGFGNGWQGKITTITSTYFEITLTQIGIGLSITGKMHLIEG